MSRPVAMAVATPLSERASMAFGHAPFVEYRAVEVECGDPDVLCVEFPLIHLVPPPVGLYRFRGLVNKTVRG